MLFYFDETSLSLTMPPVNLNSPIQFDDELAEAVDVLIIGGGVAGVCAARYLNKAGVSVFLCEKGRVAGEQSSRNWGWVRQQGRDEAELPIMMDSINAWEEIDIISSGLNYGWNEMEGNHCYPPNSNCNPNNFEPPIWEYELYVDGVCSVTGGYVYRGDALWMLEGQYIYGDWCTGDIWALNYDDDFGIAVNTSLLQSDINITSFGLDENNELLFCGNGNIYKLTSDLGDLNQDQQINILDIVLLVNLVLEKGYSEIADINNDNIINILDVIQLLNVILD